MSNIIKMFESPDPDTLLENMKGHMDQLFIIGWDKDGLLTMSCTSTTPPQLVWLLEQAKLFVLEGGMSEDE